MPPLIALLIKNVVIPGVIWAAHKTGFTNWAENMAFKYGYMIVKDIGGLKVYSKPSDYPQTATEAAATNNADAATNNLTVEQPPGV